MTAIFTHISRPRLAAALALLAAALVVPGQVATGQTPAKKDSSNKVKVEATASKTDAAGNQQITLKLTIEKGWYIYANPLDNRDYEGNETRVSVTGPTPPVEVKTAYPPGHVHTTDGVSYRIYEGEVILTTAVRRAAGDSNPLQLNIHVNSCNHIGVCLLPGEIKLNVPANAK